MSAPGFQMDDSELITSFRQAKDRRAQIYVLSDLNCVSPHAVAQRLKDLGALDGTRIRPDSFSNLYTPVRAAPTSSTKKPRIRNQTGKPAKIGRPSTWDHVLAEDLFLAGKSDTEIAEACGVSPHTIRNWRLTTKKRRTAPHAPPGCGKRRRKPMKKEVTDQAPADECDTEVLAEAQDADPAQNKSPQGDAPETAAEAPVGYIAPLPEEKQPAADVQALTLGGFRRALTTYLPAVLNEAELYIDGEPILDLYGFSVTTPDGVQVVDLLTRRGEKVRA